MFMIVLRFFLRFFLGGPEIKSKALDTQSTLPLHWALSQPWRHKFFFFLLFCIGFTPIHALGLTRYKASTLTPLYFLDPTKFAYLFVCFLDERENGSTSASLLRDTPGSILRAICSAGDWTLFSYVRGRKAPYQLYYLWP